MSRPARKGGGQPWLAIAMLLTAQALLVATVVSPAGHSFAHGLVVILWTLTSIAAMLKERVAYGMGDRVTLFGVALTLAVSIAAALLDRATGGPLSLLSVLSLAAAAIMLVQAVRNVLTRLDASER